VSQTAEKHSLLIRILRPGQAVKIREIDARVKWRLPCPEYFPIFPRFDHDNDSSRRCPRSMPAAGACDLALRMVPAIVDRQRSTSRFR